MTEDHKTGAKRWIAPGIPIVAAGVVAAWAALEFATEVHGYVAAYWNPAVMLLAGLFVILGVMTVVSRRTRRFGVGAIIGGLVLVPMFLGAVNVLDATGNIRWRNRAQVRFGPDVRASLVVYLQEGTSNDQINSVWETVLSNPDSGGSGHWHLPGIGGIARVTPVDNHEALAVTIRPDATQEQMSEIHRRLEECEYVYKVLENVVPADVATVE